MTAEASSQKKRLLKKVYACLLPQGTETDRKIEKWGMDLKEAFFREDWKQISEFNHSFSTTTSIRVNKYNCCVIGTLHHIDCQRYILGCLVNAGVVSFLHIWWQCTLIRKSWKLEHIRIKEIVHVNLPFCR